MPTRPIRDSSALLLDVWAGLPVFRLVAARRSMSAAGEALRLSGSAISRTIKGLEGALGFELFYRQGRSLTVTPKGERLLLAMDHATQSLREGLEEIAHGAFVRRLCVAGLGDLIRLIVVPARPRLSAKLGADLLLQLKSEISPALGLAGLRDGSYDLYVGVNMSAERTFAEAVLGTTPMVIVIGVGHPAFNLPDLRAEDLLAYPFAARAPHDGIKNVWPSSVRREVGLVLDDHGLGQELEVLREYAVVMWAHAARIHPTPERIRVIAAPFIEPPTIKAFFRAERAAEPSLGAVIGELKHELASWGEGA